jgi:hypothetical protein
MSSSSSRRSVIPPLRRMHYKTKSYFKQIISSVPYSVYGCFTFDGRVGQETALKLYLSFINDLSSGLIYRENIGYVYGLEMTLSGCSRAFNERRHFHFILLSHAPLSAKGIQKRWTVSYGNAKCEFYDNSKDGVGYILKKIDQEQCEWDVSDNFYLFVPHYQPKNKHERRALDRQKTRKNLREDLEISIEKNQSDPSSYLDQRPVGEQEVGRKYSFEELFGRAPQFRNSQTTKDAVKQG